MKRHIYLLIAISFVYTRLLAQTDCGPGYTQILKDASEAYAQGHYRQAYEKYRAAKGCKYADIAFLDKNMDQAMNAIDHLRIDAEKNRALAIRAKLDAQINARSAFLSAQAIDAENQGDLPLALRLVNQACLISGNQNLLALKYRHNFLRSRYLTLYKTVFEGHMGSVNSAVFAPEGQSVMTAASDNSVRIWNFEGRMTQLFFNSGIMGTVFSAKYSSDGRLMLTVDNSGFIKLWDIRDNRAPVVSFIQKDANNAVFSPDSRFILSSSNSTANLYNLEGEKINSFNSGDSYIKAMDFSPDGLFIITAHSDGTAKLWGITGNIIRTFSGHSAPINAVAFSPDGHSVLTGSSDRTAKLWDMEGNIVLNIEHNSSVTAVAYSRIHSILIGCDDGTATLWKKTHDPETYEDIRSKVLEFKGHSAPVTSVAFSSDEQFVLTASADKTAKLWNTADLIYQDYTDYHKLVTSMDVSPDGKLILLGRDDKTAELWSLNGEKIQTFLGHKRAINKVTFSPDGRFILTASEDNTAKLWNLQGEEMRTFSGHSKKVTTAIFSPDGRFVLTGSGDNTAKLWDLEGNVLRTFSQHSDDILSAAFSPDSRFFVTGSRDNTARLWHTNRDSALVVYNCKGGVAAVAFSPDGKKILTGGNDNILKLWDIRGNEIQTFPSHEREITTVLFSADGLSILSGSKDFTAKIWSVNPKLKQQPLLTVHLEYQVCGADFLPGGESVIIAGSYGFTLVSRPLTRLDDSDITTMQKLRGGLIEESDCDRSVDAAELLGCVKYILENLTLIVIFDPETYEEKIIYDELALWKARDLLQKAYSLQPRGEAGLFWENNVINRLAWSESVTPTPPAVKYLDPVNHEEKILFYDNALAWKSRQLDARAQHMGYISPVPIATKLSLTLTRYDSLQYALRLLACWRDIHNIDSLFQRKIGDSTRIAKALSSAYGSLAWSQIFVGDYSGAIRSVQQGLELSPDNSWILTHLVLGYVLTGKWKEAENIYKNWQTRSWAGSDMPYTPSFSTFREVFLKDINDLERMGVSHSDFAKARTLLHADNR